VVLQTGSRDLQLHPHVHCIVTGGGLVADGSRWLSARSQYLFPARVMAALFRGKLLDGLERLRQERRLRLDGPAVDLSHPVAWADFKDRLYRANWVVYAKRPFGGPDQVIRYLGRYTHRVAISNSRLVALDGDRVRFRTRGEHVATLPGPTFVGRFLLHVLPKGFVKIRHFGLMASVNVPTRLARARDLLAPRPTDSSAAPSAAAPDLTSPGWQPRCPACGSTDLVYLFPPAPVRPRPRPVGSPRAPPTQAQPRVVYV